MDRTIRELAEYFQREDGFAIIAHTSPDGDTLGSSLALFHAMKDMGKQAVVVCSDPVPRAYHFLPGAEGILPPEQAPELPHGVAVDCADRKRMGRAQQLLERAEDSVNIDHHVTNSGYAQRNLVDSDAAAVGEIMFDLLSELPCGVGREAATCLYTAIITDTGNFSYGNTTAKTFETAAALVRCGVDVANVNALVYRTVPYVKTKLMGLAINRMELLCGGRLGVCALTREEITGVGASGEDTEGIIDTIRDVETVEIAVLVREAQEGLCRVSLRSKTHHDVSALAAAFGGGGHEHAAGMSISGTAPQVRELVIREAQRVLEG